MTRVIDQGKRKTLLNSKAKEMKNLFHPSFEETYLAISGLPQCPIKRGFSIIIYQSKYGGKVF
jgi:hypothetical protein